MANKQAFQGHNASHLDNNKVNLFCNASELYLKIKLTSLTICNYWSVA